VSISSRSRMLRSRVRSGASCRAFGLGQSVSVAGLDEVAADQSASCPCAARFDGANPIELFRQAVLGMNCDRIRTGQCRPNRYQ
jgi:hypothetical protein